MPSSKEPNAMTTLNRNRINGWLVPAIIALVAAFALAMPGFARACDTSQGTTATPVTATVSPAGTSVGSANSVVTPTTSSTDTTTLATDDTSATDSTTSAATDPSAVSSLSGSSDPGAAGSAGVAQPNAASWR